MRRSRRKSRRAALLDSATRLGAEALGFGDDFGTIDAGKRAALMAVRAEGVARCGRIPGERTVRPTHPMARDDRRNLGLGP